MRWEGVEEADSYNVYRTDAPQKTRPGEPQIQDVEETRLTDEAVDNGRTYYYRVTAVNDDGESSPSEEKAVTPFLGPPERPDR